MCLAVISADDNTFSFNASRYTQEELEAIEAERNKPTYDQRLAAMEETIEMLLAGVTDDE
jgi:hypothetical protein